jgi:LETM1 and EF-hand domain-containing protein 1
LEPPKVKQETGFEQALREAKEEELKTETVQQSSTTTEIQSSDKKKSLWVRIKEEASHYWHGSKLLAAETKISSFITPQFFEQHQMAFR